MRPLFVQIKCELGETGNVADALIEKIEETAEVYSTSGQYDLLAKFNLEETQGIHEFVSGKLHKIAHIRDTYTIIAFRIFGAPDSPDFGLSRRPAAR